MIALSDTLSSKLCGQNCVSGSQFGIVATIGGTTVKFSPSGTARSPAITGFTGMGVDGIGWGTGAKLDKAWGTEAPLMGPVRHP